MGIGITVTCRSCSFNKSFILVLQRKQKYLNIGIKELGIGLFMGVAMVIGTWAGKKVIDKMSKEKFVKFVGVLLCLVGLQMLIFGQ